MYFTVLHLLVYSLYNIYSVQSIAQAWTCVREGAISRGTKARLLQVPLKESFCQFMSTMRDLSFHYTLCVKMSSSPLPCPLPLIACFCFALCVISLLVVSVLLTIFL